MKSLCIKKYIIFSLIIVLLCICFFCFFYKDNISVSSIVNTRQKIDGHVCNFIIDGSIGAFDSSNDSFYYSIDSTYRNNVSSFKIKSSLNFKYKLLNPEILNYKDGKILIYNDIYYQIINIYFVSVPVISIYDNFNIDYSTYDAVDSNFFKENLDESYDMSAIKDMFININYGNRQKNYNSSGDYHIRGASSLLFDKKSYKINLDNSTYLFNNNKYDEFILDALYSDSSKIRNKFSSDLWNFINDNQVYDNDLYTDFVELFINDEYKGLYVIKNSVDRKFLNVNNDGFVAKTRTDFNQFFYDRLFSETSITNDNMILNYELKYYDNSTDIQNLFLTRMKRLYNSNFDYSSVNDIFYLDNYVNYKLLVTLIMGVDNVSKNNYISMKFFGDKFLITPWDMDLSFGTNWDINSFNGASFYFDNYLDLDWIDSFLSKESPEIQMMISLRYKNLRKSKLNDAVISSMLDSYKNYLLKSGSAQRDSNLWYNYDVESEIEVIKNWMFSRLDVLDNYFFNIDN